MKDLAKLIEAAQQQGWRLKSGRHHRLYSPDKKTIVVVAKSASDTRAYANTLARMRRAGFNG